MKPLSPEKQNVIEWMAIIIVMVLAWVGLIKFILWVL